MAVRVVFPGSKTPSPGSYIPNGGPTINTPTLSFNGSKIQQLPTQSLLYNYIALQSDYVKPKLDYLQKLYSDQSSDPQALKERGEKARSVLSTLPQGLVQDIISSNATYSDKESSVNNNNLLRDLFTPTTQKFTNDSGQGQQTQSGINQFGNLISHQITRTPNVGAQLQQLKSGLSGYENQSKMADKSVYDAQTKLWANKAAASPQDKQLADYAKMVAGKYDQELSYYNNNAKKLNDLIGVSESRPLDVLFSNQTTTSVDGKTTTSAPTISTNSVRGSLDQLIKLNNKDTYGGQATTGFEPAISNYSNYGPSTPYGAVASYALSPQGQGVLAGANTIQMKATPQGAIYNYSSPDGVPTKAASPAINNQALPQNAIAPQITIEYQKTGKPIVDDFLKSAAMSVGNTIVDKSLQEILNQTYDKNADHTYTLSADLIKKTLIPEVVTQYTPEDLQKKQDSFLADLQKTGEKEQAAKDLKAAEDLALKKKEADAKLAEDELANKKSADEAEAKRKAEALALQNQLSKQDYDSQIEAALRAAEGNTALAQKQIGAFDQAQREKDAAKQSIKPVYRNPLGSASGFAEKAVATKIPAKIPEGVANIPSRKMKEPIVPANKTTDLLPSINGIEFGGN